MDPDDFLNSNMPVTVPQKAVQAKKNKKRKRSEDKLIPQTTEDLSENDIARPNESENVKRMKFNQFVIPKDFDQSKLTNIKVQADDQKDQIDMNCYVGKLQNFSSGLQATYEKSFCIMKFLFRKTQNGVYFYFGQLIDIQTKEPADYNIFS